MVGSGALAAAVVAEDVLGARLVLLWQALRGHEGVQHLEVYPHVAHGLGADGAGVVVPCVSPKAAGVHEVPARQLLDWRGGVEQVLMAHCAVPLKAALATSVLLKQREAHARVAFHAVEEVDAEALPPAADVARGAVVDVSAGLIVKEVADGAVVPRHRVAAAAAAPRRQLPDVANLAHHLPHGIAVHLVILHFVMAQAAVVHLVAARRHQRTVPLVVLTSRRCLRWPSGPSQGLCHQSAMARGGVGLLGCRLLHRAP
mmetsp:Transcript_7552/g.21405  ORF Transcript_7552/g.21405 Transcript_7552/m.21405 type:complete len:258 (+) Transcript_7552:273-1046(+)